MNAIERLPRGSVESSAEIIKTTARLFADAGSPLYAALGARIPEDPEVLALASHGLAAFPAVHLFAAVHYLLLGNTSDPLGRYFATVTEMPMPPDEAFPAFAGFCRRHREEILQLMSTRTIQATSAERCQALAPLFSHIADRAGEPLDLIEIGCSAGVLLTFDKYAYDLKDRGFIGSKSAPLTLRVDVRGGSKFHIARVGQRIGIDLRPVDARQEDERRWLLALCYPEGREIQARLAIALDTVARTNIRILKGDALDLLPELIAESSGPLCIFHSACVLYWSDEAKAALDALLLDASHGREFFRVGLEPDIRRMTPSDRLVDIAVTRYRHGTVDSGVAARTSADCSLVTWLD